MTKLTDTEQVESLFASERPVLLFKHSTRCGISARASREVERFRSESPDVNVAWATVLVVEDRSVSQWVASRLDIPHASPQLILVVDGNSVWHTSHGSITTTSIRRALEEHGLWSSA